MINALLIQLAAFVYFRTRGRNVAWDWWLIRFVWSRSRVVHFGPTIDVTRRSVQFQMALHLVENKKLWEDRLVAALKSESPYLAAYCAFALSFFGKFAPGRIPATIFERKEPVHWRIVRKTGTDEVGPLMENLVGLHDPFQPGQLPAVTLSRPSIRP
jgi:hypothetical protein